MGSRRSFLLGLLVLAVLVDGVHCHHQANLDSDGPRLRARGCGSTKAKDSPAASPARSTPTSAKPAPAQPGSTGSAAAGSVGTGTAGAVTPVTGGAIKVTEKGLAHVMARHITGGARTTGKSLFSGGETEVRSLIEAAERVSPTLQKGGNLQRIVDAGRTIGVDRATGAPTSMYTVITTKAGELVTAFPGVP